MKQDSIIIRRSLPFLLLIGLLLRVVVYFQNRSLFLDEANLAKNIAERSFPGLFSGLDYQQYAPPLFLVLEKVNWMLAGASEWALRFWPLSMGCLSLYLFYRIITELSPRSIATPLIFWLFAFSQVYVRYATEVKQYSTDMAVSTALIWAALRFSPFERSAFWYYWVLLGSVAIWLSMPAVFVLTGVGAYFFYQQLYNRTSNNNATVSAQGSKGESARGIASFRHQRRAREIDANVASDIHQSTKIQSGSQFWLLLLMGGIWLAQFGLYFYLIIGHDVGKTDLVSYHQTYFWPLWPTSAAAWERILFLLQSLSSTLIGHTIWANLIGLIGLISGSYFLFKKQLGRLLLFALPVLTCILASGLGLYSLIERLTLFMMPLLGLLLLAGYQEILAKVTRWRSLLLLLAFVPILPLRKGLVHFSKPLQNEEMRPLLNQLDTLVQAGDQLWVDHNARPAFEWYTHYNKQNLVWEADTSIIYNHWNQVATLELEKLAGSSTTYWLIFSHLVSDYNRQEMQADLNAMQRIYGPPIETYKFPGVTAYKFEQL